MRDDSSITEVFDLLADEYARAILTTTAEEHQSATMITQAITAANSTVYDKIDRLSEAGLLDEVVKIDEDGNHYSTYRARLERLNVRLTGDGFLVDLETIDRDSGADRLNDLWRELR